MVSLKKYQTGALNVLKAYLEAARVVGAKPAFDTVGKSGVRAPRPYRPLEGMETIPYVCLRLPTGGGKTLLSAHTIKLATEAYLERDYPVVLWLVPTNTIRAQTLQTLKKPGNPNYEALRTAFGSHVRVFDITDFTMITPADLQTGACVVVGTMQTLRVANTDGRKVYAHNENLEPHFTAVPGNMPGMERIEQGDDKGQIKFSFRNLLALHRPLVLVDEAHNNTSSLSFEVLQRINAACVVEFTATPAADSNVLHGVSATELKAEEMIKLPIRLEEHKSWEEAVRDSILTRKRLNDIAMEDRDYIRPIVLFQAEEKGKEVTKEILLAHLVEQEKIPREKIAVVTGDQKELDGINLFAPECPIDFVITVEALKEGWDCSFAYVFCSVASVHSSKDVEQILGRVLRMPYAQRRKNPDLNRAYAHVSKSSWPNAVRQLHDRLVDMGFEDSEADAYIEHIPELGLTGGAAAMLSAGAPPTVIELAEDISAFMLSPEEESVLQVEKTGTGSRIILTGQVSENTVQRLTASLRTDDARKSFTLEAKRHGTIWLQHASPAQRGVPFNVPQLCFKLDGALELAEDFLDVGGWSLQDYSAELSEAEFHLTESGVQWEIDLNAAGQITEKAIGKADQYDLDLVDTGWTEAQLCGWLEKKVRQQDITQPTMLQFVRRAVTYLTDKRDLPLTALVRWRFILAKVLAQKIAQNREQAGKACYQDVLFGPQAAVETSFSIEFPFGPNDYALHWPYAGHPYQFQKHYYGLIGELANKGEEYECAKALDVNKHVKHWVRNLERRGFSLPLAKGNFYPDFVAELNDGRILVLEYKGAHLAKSDDTSDKRLIGELWAERSNGRGIFLMIEGKEYSKIDRALQALH